MASLAIIPARGGSKRIPKKNIKDFLGKPIIAYSIELALGSNLFDEVMVSTDDNEIAEIAIKYGARVPFMRSKQNSDDFATTFDVLREVQLCYQRDYGRLFDFICCIYPTAPLIKVGKLTEGLNLLKSKNFDSVFPVVAFSYPIWRSLEMNGDKVSMIWKDYLNHRSQDLKRAYHDAGQWYWFNPKKVSISLFTENTGAVELSEEEVQDIDNLVDWKLAELKYQVNAK